MKKLIDVLGEPTGNTATSARTAASSRAINIWAMVSLMLGLIIIGGAIVIVFIFKPDLAKLAFWQENKGAVSPLGKEKSAKPAKSSYAAVFLTNNQVYFGQLFDKDSNYPKLRDVYYLRVQQTIEPAELQEAQKVKVAGKEEATSIQPAVKNEMTLIKLGNEIHGPIDEIQLNRQHILYIEELKDDSKVVKAINDFRNSN